MNQWLPLTIFIAGVPVAVLTSWLTVRFALRRFQSEKWFERKVDAYTKVIESLHFIKRYGERRIHALERGQELAKEDDEGLRSTYRQGFADLRRLTDMGSLVFSAQAIAVLEALNNELAVDIDSLTSWELVDLETTATTKCLNALRTIAKTDLNA